MERQTIIERPEFVAEVPLVSGFRIGFSQYSSGFSNVSFSYHSYGYWPYGRCVSSPWYDYPQLPPYLPTSVVYVQQPIAYSTDYDAYDWAPPAPTRVYGTLDYCVNDIDSAYTSEDPELILQLIPSDGMISVFLEGSYRYSVGCNDFRPMLVDCVRHVRTSGYHVDWVRRYHDGTVMVEGEHNTRDAWGHTETVYQTYRMEPYRGHYAIREFGTSHHRI